MSVEIFEIREVVSFSHNCGIDSIDFEEFACFDWTRFLSTRLFFDWSFDRERVDWVRYSFVVSFSSVERCLSFDSNVEYSSSDEIRLIWRIDTTYELNALVAEIEWRE